MPWRSDIWRIGAAPAPIADIVAAASLEGLAVRWLPQEPLYRFLADPFGLWRDGRLFVFAEAYDYRTRHGVIDVLELDAGLAPVARRTVLREPWHLSYPFVFEAEGAVWMAPEAHRSGALTLYRAEAFPDDWAPAVRLQLDTPAIDATPFWHGGLWWLAYSPTGSQARKQGRLHLAFAEALTGPWRTHPGNPVRVDRGGSRPGGTPFVAPDGVLILPVQDCTRTYGGAIRPLRILTLTPDCFEAEAGAAIAPPAQAAPYLAGLHTLSAAGDVTLIDVKRTEHLIAGLAIEAVREAGAKIGRARTVPARRRAAP